MKHIRSKLKEKKQRIKPKREINNLIFPLVCFVVAFLVISASIVVAVFDAHYQWICWDANAIGIISQVITATVAFVASIIGIAISLQNDKCFDIEVKKFNELRSGCFLSIKTFIMAGVTFSALNVTFYAASLTIASLTVAFISVLLCLFMVYTEIPIMVKREKALIHIIKSWLINHWKYTKKLPKDIKTVLKFLVVNEKNIKETYSLLKSKDKEYNQFLIDTLLDVQCDAAKDLMIEADDYICDNVIRNIRDILCFHFDLTEIMSSDSFYSSHTYLTFVCFQLAKTERYKERAERLLTDQLFTLKYQDLSSDKENFVVGFILGIVLNSIADGNLHFLTAIQEHFSAHHHELEEGGLDTVIFALISMQLYYLCHDSSNATQELKTTLLDFVDREGVRNNIKLYSWRTLFNWFSENFSVDFSKFYKYFRLQEHSFDVRRYWEAQFVILTNEYVAEWYLSNILNSSSLWGFDFRTFTDTDRELSYYLKRIEEKCLNPQTHEFTPSENMESIVSFYDPNKEHFAWLKASEQEAHRLFEFINNLRKEDLSDQIRKASSVDDDEIADKYRNAIESAITHEWGYDDSLEVDSAVKTMNLLVQKSNNAINYDEAMIQWILRTIFRELASATSITTFPLKKNYDELFKQILKIKPAYISKSAIHLGYFIKDPDLKEKAQHLYGASSAFHSGILNGQFFIANNCFSFNLNMVEFASVRLTSDQISKEVENYKRDDGQYVCEGAFVSREELEDWIAKTYIILRMAIQYTVVSNKNGIIKIIKD